MDLDSNFNSNLDSKAEFKWINPNLPPSVGEKKSSWIPRNKARKTTDNFQIPKKEPLTARMILIRLQYSEKVIRCPTYYMCRRKQIVSFFPKQNWQSLGIFDMRFCFSKSSRACALFLGIMDPAAMNVLVVDRTLWHRNRIRRAQSRSVSKFFEGSVGSIIFHISAGLECPSNTA